MSQRQSYPFHHKSNTRWPWLGLIAILVAGSVVVLGQWGIVLGQPPVRKIPRAAPPDFRGEDFSEIFFKNLKEPLQGSPPALARIGMEVDRPKIASGRSADNSPKVIAQSDDKQTVSNRTSMISPQTLEDTIKESKLRLDKFVTTPVRFSSGGSKEARREFTLLSVLFGIIDEHPENVRWKSSAATARVRFAQAARNAKVASPQSFNEAKQRLVDLEDILNGTTLQATNTLDASDGPILADRSVIMQILEWTHRDNLVKFTSAQVKALEKKEEINRFSELMAGLAGSLEKEGMPDADDKAYTLHIHSLLDGTASLIRANQEGDGDAARVAVGKIEQTCSRCHDSYR